MQYAKQAACKCLQAACLWLVEIGRGLSLDKSRIHSIGKRGQAGEFQIGLYLGIWIGCGTPARLVVAAVNPYRVQAHRFGRHMVVK